MGEMDNRGTLRNTHRGNYALKSDFLSAFSHFRSRPPSPIHNVSLVSKRLVLVGRGNNGAGRTENGKVGAMDNRGAPRNTHRRGSRHQIRLFISVFPLSLFSCPLSSSFRTVPSVSAISKRLVLVGRAEYGDVENGEWADGHNGPPTTCAKGNLSAPKRSSFYHR